MRLLHTADWHLGKSLYDFPLLDDQQYFIDRFLDILRSREVDAVLIAGDIFDRPVPGVDAIRLYDYFLSEAVGGMGITVLAIAGNHDSAGRLEFGSSLYRRSGYYIAGEVSGKMARAELRDSHGAVHIYLLPYLHPADARGVFTDPSIRSFDSAYKRVMDENLARITKSSGTRNILLAHGFFSDLRNAGETKPLITSDSEINIGGVDIADARYFDVFDYVALGHLHTAQRALGEKVRYSGSPLKYSLSEECGHKSVTLVDIGADGLSGVTEISVPAMYDVRSVNGTLAALLDPSLHENKNFGDYVFAEISGLEEPFAMEKLRTLFPRLLGLSFSGSRGLSMPDISVRSGSLTSRPSIEELFMRFFKDTRGEDMTDSQLSVIRQAVYDMEREYKL